MKSIQLVFYIVLLIILASCQRAPLQSKKLSGYTMGTTYNIIYVDSLNRNFQYQVDSILVAVNLSLSTYIDSSIISKVNEDIDSLFIYDEHFKTVFLKAKEIYKITNGFFDPTVMPLVNVYGFGYEKYSKDSLSERELDSLKVLVNFEGIEMKGSLIAKSDVRLKLDFSAIAKGYGVDILANYFNEIGIRNYMVEIGGEVRTMGKDEKGEWWRIGIDEPQENNSNRELQTIIQLKNKSIATSGNYRNYRIQDGKKYVHTINPKTGLPEINNLLSVSVVADDCMTADAYATAFMTMGLDTAWGLIQQIPKLEGFFIFLDQDSINVKYTKHFNQ